MKKKKFFLKPNLFTPLIVLAAFAFAFRAGNILTHWDKPASEIGVVSAASAVEDTHETEATSQPHVSGVVMDDEDMPPPPEGMAEQATAFSSSEIELLQSLAKRRDALDGREKDIAMREALLKAAEQEIDSKLKELAKLKTEMEELIGKQGKEEEARVQSLVKIYENMKPADAARIFDQLDMRILLDVVGRMKERKVSPVLANMSPEKAKDITTQLAEERKLPAAGKAAVADTAPALPN